MPAHTKTKPLPPEVREKLIKVLPMLSSNHEGEQLGAIAAIKRVLQAAGLDWHDFTAWTTAAAPSPPPRNEWSPPPPPQKDHADYVSIPSDRVIARIETLRAQCSFSAASEEFLNGLLERADAYADVFFSPKMQKWFRDIERQAARRRRT
jgi:hypothetical protein